MSAVFECLSGQKSGGAFAYSCGDEKVVVSVSIGRYADALGVKGDGERFSVAAFESLCERMPCFRLCLRRGVQGDAWDRLKESPLFADWVARFCPAGRLRLKSVCIQQVLPHFQLGEKRGLGGSCWFITRLERGPSESLPMRACVSRSRGGGG